jgi:hypothetical protein
MAQFADHCSSVSVWSTRVAEVYSSQLLLDWRVVVALVETMSVVIVLLRRLSPFLFSAGE